MSAESLAALRKSVGPELADLAAEHLKHDLNQKDRDKLEAAAKQFWTYSVVGSVIGLSLGVLAATRVRSARKAMFTAFRASEKPTHVQFAGGRTEPIPDITPLLKPSTAGDVTAYLLFSAGGLFIGGELGALSGSFAAKRSITQDPESRARIETAFRHFRADLLKKQIKDLEQGQEGLQF